MWTCATCKTQVGDELDACWNCGTSAEGVPDPGFVTADDAGPIELDDDPVVPALATEGLETGPMAELVQCYQALSLVEAKFLADQLRGEGIPATADAADMQDTRGGWTGNPHVYCRAEDLPRARDWLNAYERDRRAEHGQPG